jgi:hypothetical protein
MISFKLPKYIVSYCSGTVVATVTLRVSQPPLPVSIEQLLATQNELMRVLMENLVHRGVCQPHHQPVMDSSYTDFLVMHPLLFIKASDPLEADN